MPCTIAGMPLHQPWPLSALSLGLSGAVVTRIADPVVEVRDRAGGLLGVLPWGGRGVARLLGAWSGRDPDGRAWALAVGYGFPADDSTVRFQRRDTGSSFLTPETCRVEFMDDNALGAPWAAEVAGEFAAVSYVSGPVREARGLDRVDDQYPLRPRAA